MVGRPCQRSWQPDLERELAGGIRDRRLRVTTASRSADGRSAPRPTTSNRARMFGVGRISVVLRPGSEGQRFKPQAELDAVARVVVVGWLLAPDFCLLARSTRRPPARGQMPSAATRWTVLPQTLSSSIRLERTSLARTPRLVIGSAGSYLDGRVHAVWSAGIQPKQLLEVACASRANTGAAPLPQQDGAVLGRIAPPPSRAPQSQRKDSRVPAPISLHFPNPAFAHVQARALL
jgi:hypothetical protein